MEPISGVEIGSGMGNPTVLKQGQSYSMELKQKGVEDCSAGQILHHLDS